VPVDPDLAVKRLGNITSSPTGNSNERPHGPRRLVVSGFPAGWTLEEIRAAGTDATDRPLAFCREINR
jgi:hypothetical protein